MVFILVGVGTKILLKEQGDSMSDGGKGSSPRPFSVDQKTFDENWDRIFNRKKPTDLEKFDQIIMKDEYFDLDDDEKTGC